MGRTWGSSYDTSSPLALASGSRSPTSCWRHGIAAICLQSLSEALYRPGHRSLQDQALDFFSMAILCHACKVQDPGLGKESPA